MDANRMSALQRIRNRLSFRNALFFPLTVGIVFFLKRHYSEASPDDLLWILKPTSRLVAVLTGIPFVFEKRIGYLSDSVMFIIAKPCAGVNFLIIVFCMSVFAIVPRAKRLGSKLAAFLGIAAGAYLATVLVNAFRIIAAIYSYRAGISIGWFTPERVHRIEGAGIYFLFLWLIHISTRSALGPRVSRIAPAKQRDALAAWKRLASLFLAPLVWYLGMTVLVPLVRSARGGYDARIVEHFACVVLVPLLMAGLLFLVHSTFRKRPVRLAKRQ